MVKRLHDPDGDGVIDPSTSLFDSSSGSPDEYRTIAFDQDTQEWVRGSSILRDPDCLAAGGIVSGNTCRYNFIDQSGPIPGEERYTVFSEFDYQFGEDLFGLDSMSAFGEIGFGRNSAERAIGPQASGNGPAFVRAKCTGECYFDQ